MAQHYLTVPDPGPEGEPHSHHYELELTFRGADLNQYDYLIDIDDAEATLSTLALRYRDELLNDLPEFEGLADWLTCRRQQAADGELLYLTHQLDVLGRVPD